jgi:selenocysteine-specific elongation factor
MTVVATDDGKVGFSRANWEALCSRILGELERAQNSVRGAVGLPLSGLKMLLVPESGKGLAKGIVDELLRQSMIVLAAGGYCLASQQTRMSLEDETLWNSIDASLSNSGLKPMSVAELVLETGADKRRVISFLGRASHRGLVTRLSPTLVAKPLALGKIGELLARLTQQHSDGIFTVPSFRDASGIGRNRSIEILEFFDSKRITIRVGEGRRLLPTAEQAFASLLKNDEG